MASTPASPPVGLYASHQPPHFCRGTFFFSFFFL